MSRSSALAQGAPSGAGKIKTVLFDASGVLLDDLRAVWEANAKVVARFTGASLGLDEFRRRFVLPYWRFYEGLGITAAEARKEANELFKQFYASVKDQIALFPEVPKALQSLSQQRLRLGIVSQVPRDFLTDYLERHDIGAFFEVVIGLEDGSELKPSPKPIQEALLRMGLTEPSEAAYVGDMEEDTIAGRRAGVMTVAVLRLISYQPWFKVKRQHPDHVIFSLSELPRIFAST